MELVFNIDINNRRHTSTPSTAEGGQVVPTNGDAVELLRAEPSSGFRFSKVIFWWIFSFSVFSHSTGFPVIRVNNICVLQIYSLYDSESPRCWPFHLSTTPSPVRILAAFESFVQTVVTYLYGQ